jgi:4-carboxymuconolactone decarboxylase
MNQNDNACGAIGRTASQDRLAAALLPIVAIVFIAVPVIGLAMPVHLDLGLSDFASGLGSGSQFAASFLSRMWAGDWLQFISPARRSCLAAPSSPFACSMRRRLGKACPPFGVDDRRFTMKLQAAAIAFLSLMAMPSARAEEITTMTGLKPLTYEDVRKVAPALEAYTQNRLLGEVWKRPGLAPRDRSMVTLAVLIARNQTIEMPYHFNLALENGVKPREISEVITHLAFYSGWANAMSAVAAARDVFAVRNIGADQLAAASVTPLPIDEAAEARRAASVEGQFGPFFPGVVQYTTDVLFRDLWLRPDLAPRDRSLVTISALIANGQTAQLTPHLNKAMDNGLTQGEAAEAITHLAFYVGWPNVFSAMPVAKDVFGRRSR